MDLAELKTRIRRSITTVTSIAPEDIGDNDSYKDDLALDSLSILEIAVDVESQFRIKVPEEEISAIRTVEDTARVVRKYLCVEVA